MGGRFTLPKAIVCCALCKGCVYCSDFALRFVRDVLGLGAGVCGQGTWLCTII